MKEQWICDTLTIIIVVIVVVIVTGMAQMKRNAAKVWPPYCSFNSIKVEGKQECFFLWSLPDVYDINNVQTSSGHGDNEGKVSKGGKFSITAC